MTRKTHHQTKPRPNIVGLIMLLQHSQCESIAYILLLAQLDIAKTRRKLASMGLYGFSTHYSKPLVREREGGRDSDLSYGASRVQLRHSISR